MLAGELALAGVGVAIVERRARRMPDLDLVTANGPLRVFSLLCDAGRCYSTSVSPAAEITPWADRVQLIDAKYVVHGSFRHSGHKSAHGVGVRHGVENSTHISLLHFPRFWLPAGDYAARPGA